MVHIEQVAPVLPVSDIGRAIELYRLLGFDVTAYAGGAPYAFARRDGVQLHLSEIASIDPLTSTVSVYLYVDDAAALHSQWRAAAVGGRLVEPHPTDYGLLEGAFVDPDGNLLLFGSTAPSDRAVGDGAD